jgi:HPt (histidine-containing phosphotransfer) domain-containing protein
MQLNDVKTLRTLIHQLRGACGSYGFNDLTPLATRIEEELRVSDSIQSQIGSLEEFMDMCLRMTAEPA